MSTKAWSYSALKDYEGCARRYHSVRVLKQYPSPKTEQILYGERLHKACEEYTINGTPIPPEFAFVQPVVDALLAKGGRKFAEHKMGVTYDGQSCDFFDKRVWLRGVADLLIVDDDNLTATCVDYKSGNDRYPDTDQLELMSLMTFAHFPHVRQVKSALLFVVKNNIVRFKMEISQADKMWWRYRERAAKLAASYENNVWNPTPSGLCRKWCPVTSCEFNGNH
jgi:hypothetical protein